MFSLSSARRRLPPPSPRLVVWSAALVYAAMASWFSLRRHDAFLSEFDLANFDQALWLVSRGEEPFITQYGRNYLGDHFGLGILLLAPLYVLGAGSSTLLVLQSVLIALTAPLLDELARARGARGWPAAIPALLWLASPLTLSTSLFDFHHIPVAAPLIVGSVLALARGRVVLYAATGLLACSMKEDVSLIYLMLGVVLVLEGRRRIGVATIVASAAVFAFAVGVFLPRFSNSLLWFAERFAGDRGDSVAGVGVWMLRHPLDAIGELATGQNLFVCAALIVSTGGLCLLSLRWMLQRRISATAASSTPCRCRSSGPTSAVIGLEPSCGRAFRVSST